MTSSFVYAADTYADDTLYAYRTYELVDGQPGTTIGSVSHSLQDYTTSASYITAVSRLQTAPTAGDTLVLRHAFGYSPAGAGAVPLPDAGRTDVTLDELLAIGDAVAVVDVLVDVVEAPPAAEG